VYIQRKVGGDTMNKTRPNRVYFRVTDTELELINECVKTSGMTRQDWILSVVTSLTDPQPDIKLCPECGAAMQIKNGRRGKFWGCTNYPRCHHTEDWNGN
jgi:hypothetical protein